jgi:hypothetical protein
MPTKKEIQAQMDALAQQLASADDEEDYERIEVKEDKEGNRSYGVRVKKSDPKWAWLFGETEKADDDGDKGDDDTDKKDRQPATRNKYFGG